jgi:transketolase
MASRSDLCNALRALAMDAVQQANSGHPGMPMGMAEIAEVVWRHHLRHNPANPGWINRDRFVISNGHGSMLLYALLHLSGYDLPMTELRRFRQLHSRTPGHPEHGLTPGVETTTGPLGQGLANGVGLAIAERALAAEFNRPGFEPVDHRTYVFVGDGCLMEGISHEACSLAGTLGLGKLVAFYDDNAISIDSEKGDIRSWFTDDTPARFRAYGWNVIAPVDGHDADAVDRALRAAQGVRDRPTLVCCKTVIAKGAPNKANTGAAHGAPLGADEIAATRANIGWSHAPFEVPAEIYADWDARGRGRELEAQWRQRFAEYAAKFPVQARELERRVAGELPARWVQRKTALVEQTLEKRETIATRKASQNALEALVPDLPELIGGSADLAASNLTMVAASKPLARTGGGNYIFFGVREFGMCAVANGIALHGGLIPYVATFLVFSDYARNALRMASLMRSRVVFVFTHDSVGLGEDGPTHQPIEHAASLRLMPHMDVWRPCDSTETAVAWIAALERRDGPTSLLLSRQNLAFNARSAEAVAAIGRGGYVLADSAAGKAAAILIATGSEVSLALAARDQLAAAGIPVSVVSMPSTSVFDRQDATYRETVLPRGVPRLAIEAGVSDYWRKYVGLEGDVIGIDRFGESAPAADVFKFFGFNTDNVVARTRKLVAG